MFRISWLAPTIAFGIVTGLSSSCSQPAPNVSVADKGSAAAVTFSDDDRRAAQALAIGNVRVLETADSPLDKAVLCSLAIGEVAERLRSAGMGMAQDQIEAVTIARTIYDRRAAEAAGNAPADAISRARLRLVEAHPEPSARAQIAVACLRQLA